MERLRRKGYLTCKKMQGRYRYSARLPKAELLRSLVRDFAERVLGGSPQPNWRATPTRGAAAPSPACPMAAGRGSRSRTSGSPNSVPRARSPSAGDP